MYYFRKFSKPSTFQRIVSSDSIDSIPADILKQEFSTTGNKLSFWRSEHISNWDDAKRAIILSTTSISKSYFFAFDDDILDKYGLLRDNSERGITGYIGATDLHVNLVELNYGKIQLIIEMIREISKDGDRFPKLSIDEVKQVIRQTALEKQIDYTVLNINLFKDIGKYNLDPMYPNDLFEEIIKEKCKDCPWHGL